MFWGSWGDPLKRNLVRSRWWLLVCLSKPFSSALSPPRCHLLRGGVVSLGLITPKVQKSQQILYFSKTPTSAVEVHRKGF